VILDGKIAFAADHVKVRGIVLASSGGLDPACRAPMLRHKVPAYSFEISGPLDSPVLHISRTLKDAPEELKHWLERAPSGR
jgi:hypothetical protein